MLVQNLSSTWNKIKRLKGVYLYCLGVLDGEYAYRGPDFVQIDLTDYCNNTCLACWCNSPLLKADKFSPSNPRQILPLKLVMDLLDELKRMGTREISFSGSGEPFMHPHCVEILEYAKAKGFSCIVNTNFTLINKEMLDRLIKVGIDNLTVSVWAATPETYCLTHPTRSKADFDQIKDNLIYLNGQKKKFPKVHLYNVIFNKNYLEMEKMIDFALGVGAEIIGFALADTIPGSTDSLLFNDAELIELQKISHKIASKLDANLHLKGSGLWFYRFDDFLRRISVFEDTQQAKYDRNIIDSFPCYNGWLFARVVPNADVHSCLKAHRIPVGSLYRDNFSKVWNSSKQMFFRKKTCVCKKSDPFFLQIGNDPYLKEAGCYKGCDDIGRNIWMDGILKKLSGLQKAVLSAHVNFLKRRREAHGKRRNRSVVKWFSLGIISIISFLYSAYVWFLRSPKNELLMKGLKR